MRRQQGDRQGGRKLKVDLAELVDAFEFGSEFGEMYHYLDLETGDVVLITDDISFTLRQVYEESGADSTMPMEAFDALLMQHEELSLERSALLAAHEIEGGVSDRFFAIPQLETREAYQDMADFVGTVEDQVLRRLLEVAIDGRGAFRRFRTVLYDYPGERERWFAFKETHMRRRALDWLASEGIEPITE
jgi:hypothetical protein